MAKSTRRKTAVQNIPVQNLSQPQVSVPHKRPTIPGILIVLGGLFIIGFAILALSELSYVVGHSSNYTNVINATSLAALKAQAPYINEVSTGGLILGVAVLILGFFTLLYSDILRFSKYIAVVTAVLSIISLFDSGGLFVGTILSVVGAILLFIYKG